tara:strand:- start:1435 stop:1734 length:300 start_codon:yes stop_codon:yes gene_type:complete
MDELDQIEQSLNQGSQSMDMSPENMLMQELAQISPQEKQEAIQSLQEIINIVAQLEANGATEEEIAQFLAEIGLTIEELEMVENLLMGESQPEMNMGMM